MLDWIAKNVPVVVSLVSAIVAVASLLHKARTDQQKTPAEAAHKVAGAAALLSQAYEKRLEEAEEHIIELQARVRILEARVGILKDGIRELGIQAEEAGLVPVINWRTLLNPVPKEA